MKLLDKLKVLFKPKTKDTFMVQYVYLRNCDVSFDTKRIPKSWIPMVLHSDWKHIYAYPESNDTTYMIKVLSKDWKSIADRRALYIFDPEMKQVYILKDFAFVTTNIEFISYVNEVKRTDPYPIIQKE